MQNKVPFC